jgi:hypothetical protein
MSCSCKLTRAEQVRARSLELSIGTVAGRGDRSFLDMLDRGEEIEAWLYKAKEPAIVRAAASDADGRGLTVGEMQDLVAGVARHG